MSFGVEPDPSSDFRIPPVPDESVSVVSGPSAPRPPLEYVVPLDVTLVGTLCPFFAQHRKIQEIDNF